VCADVTPAELAAAREVAQRVKEHGPSFTKDQTRYAHAIAGAVKRVAASTIPAAPEKLKMTRKRA
jgi:hypothetical protein